MSNTGKDRRLSGAKGCTAEALRIACSGVGWAAGKYPSDCHMIFV